MIAAWAVCGAAWAGPLEADLAEARAQIEAGDHKGALKALKALEAGLPAQGAVVPRQELATLWLYRGAAEHLRGAKKNRDLDAWRQAIAVDNALPWDEALVTDGDVFSLFEALRGEVRSRSAANPGIPEATGAAKLHVDGERFREEEALIGGLHLAQVECPDGQGTFGVLTDFAQPLDWLSLCPDGVDTSVVVSDEEDEWSAFGPSFGDATETSDPVAEPATEPDPIVTPPPHTTERRFTAGTALMASGGALVAGGLVVNFALVNPAYAAIEAARDDPDSTTRAEADDLTARFNSARVLTIGLVGAGLAAGGAGFFIDTPVQPVVGWGHLGLTGAF